jgi:hypothetical protein
MTFEVPKSRSSAINAISARRSTRSCPIFSNVPSPAFLRTNALYSIFNSRSLVRSTAISQGSSLRLRHAHDRINVEAIKASLDALACTRPLLLRHVGPGIPHLHAIDDGRVMRRPWGVTRWKRSCRYLRKRCASSQAKGRDCDEEQAHGTILANRKNGGRSFAEEAGHRRLGL